MACKIRKKANKCHYENIFKIKFFKKKEKKIKNVVEYFKNSLLVYS